MLNKCDKAITVAEGIAKIKKLNEFEKQIRSLDADDR